MICAYCGKEAKGTKEHIISSGRVVSGMLCNN